MTANPGRSRKEQALVIVPGYNEAANIGRVVRQIREQQLGDVLVIDDGSSDGTAREAERAGAHVLRLPFNLGIGGAVQAGLKYAAEMGYHYAVRLDGDGQHPVDDAGKLLAAVVADQADVAIGSRFLPGQQTYTPPLSRRVGILWFAFMLKLITRHPAYDATSGMQAFNRRAIWVLARYYPQDYPEVEGRILLHRARLRVVELQAKMVPRAAGRSSITYLRAIYYMFKVSLATVLIALHRAPLMVTEEG